jgi:hypothetical protein
MDRDLKILSELVDRIDELKDNLSGASPGRGRNPSSVSRLKAMISKLDRDRALGQLKGRAARRRLNELFREAIALWPDADGD